MTTTPGTETSVLTIERDGHVATVFLDRPEKRNAMGMPFFAQLPAVMAELGADRAIRAVVIAARGPCFSVGLDLTALAGVASGDEAASSGDEAASSGDEAASSGETAPSSRISEAVRAARTRQSVLELQGSISSVADCPKPVIAAIHGYCIGGGVDLVSACDIRVAALDALFSVRETRMAMVADIGSLQRLPLIVPMGQVAELAYTGKDIDATEALRIGLVNRVEADQPAALASAREIAAQIAANSPLAVQGTKAVLSEIHRAQVTAGLHYVAAWNAGQLRSHDLEEAVRAFFERRQAEFTGE